jgi:beta-RFAP synthase
MNQETSLPSRVTVEAPARLHFGILDLRGHRGRRFGGIGAALPIPAVRLEATRAEGLTVEGPDAGRAEEAARRFMAAFPLPGAHLRLTQSIPSHVGLGSGTQLALAVARALAELHGIRLEPPALARAVGRGGRSAIGTWTFALGGFVLEGGRRPDSDAVAPLISRLPVPPSWQAIVVIPEGKPGLSGRQEADAFRGLAPPSEVEVERVAHLVLMQLLPALAEADLAEFGAALSEIQRITGSWFAAAQGGAFAAGPSAELVRQLAEFGAQGVGQSSWGPTVYGITPDPDSARDLATRVRAKLGGSGTVYQTGFSQRGALVHAEWTAVGRD